MTKGFTKPRKILAGLFALMLLTGIAFSMIGQANAQTPTTTPGATTTTPGTNTAPDGTKGPGMGQRGGPGGQKGGPGGQGDGQGGRGPGGKGVDNTTQAGATAQLAAAAKDIETAKTDLTAAKGKMDTTQVEALLAKADGLYSQADGFLKASDFVKASGYAAAAKDVVRSATELMENELGTALPSAANRPARPAQATAPADGGKAMASHQLANVYNQIVRAGTEAKANATITDAASFVTSAQDLYKKAYDLYNAGEYEKAAKTGQAAGDLAHVVESLMRANGVQPTNQPETVPAPNF